MHFETFIQDNIVLVIPNTIKKQVLLKLNEFENIFNIKIMSLEELINSITFKYSEESIYYLIKKYDMNYDVALMYLNNIKYVNDINVSSNKIEKLKNIKNELDENNLLIYDKNIFGLLKEKEVVIYGYDYIDNYSLKMLKKIDNYKIIKKEYSNFNHDVYEFNNIEDELYFVLTNIIHLIKKGVNINNIKLCNVTSEYENDLKRMFNIFNIPINIKNNKSIKSSLIFKDFIKSLKNNEIEESIDFIINKYDTSVSNNKYIVDQIIKILNTYNFVKEKDILINILINEFKKIYIKNDEYENAVNIVDLKDNVFNDNDFVFLLGFNMGNIPIIYKDEDYLSDNEKDLLGLEMSYKKNSIEKKVVINNIKSIKNLFITYKNKTNFMEYMPSLLIDELNLNVIKNIDKKYNYSLKYNDLLLYK